MSSSQNPLTGSMRKSMGNFTTVSYGGKNFIRSKPFNRKDPKTEDQMLHREKFSLLADFYQSLSKIIDKGFSVRKKGMTVYNMFISTNFSRAFDESSEEPALDYSRILVSKGGIPPVSVVESGIGAEGITIRYETNIGLPKVSATDELTAFARLKNGDFLLTGQTRGSEETGTLVLEYTDLIPQEVECCYLFGRSANGKMSSNSVAIKY